MKKIDELYAFTGIDDDGDEGVVVFQTPSGMMMPMVGADLASVESLMPIAENIALVTGKQIAIYKFSKKEIHGVIKPR